MILDDPTQLFFFSDLLWPKWWIYLNLPISPPPLGLNDTICLALCWLWREHCSDWDWFNEHHIIKPQNPPDKHCKLWVELRNTNGEYLIPLYRINFSRVGVFRVRAALITIFWLISGLDDRSRLASVWGTPDSPGVLAKAGLLCLVPVNREGAALRCSIIVQALGMKLI